MRVKAAGLVSVVTESGPEMTAAETVTMFNDMCLFAPATLIDPAIRWERVEGLFVDAAFSNAGHTVRARLEFSAEGDLVNFWSDDRRQVSAAGDAPRRVRWSTPVAGTYRTFGAVRLAAHGEARWHEEAGDYAYIELDFTDVQHNVPRRRARELRTQDPKPKTVTENRQPTTENRQPMTPVIGRRSP
jgi:hypothetical protein